MKQISNFIKGRVRRLDILLKVLAMALKARKDLDIILAENLFKRYDRIKNTI